MDNSGRLPAEIADRLKAGVPVKKIEIELAKKYEDVIAQVDSVVEEVAQRRDTCPQKVANTILAEKKLKLQRLVNADISEFALDTRMDVDKMMNEINTVSETGEDLQAEYDNLKAQLAEMQQRKEKLEDYNCEMYELVVSSPYSPVFCLPNKLPSIN